MSDHPFTKKKGSLLYLEKTQKALLFLATYAILVSTFFVFSEIIFKGAPVLKQYGWEFIKRKPETLEVVLLDSGKQLEIPAESFETLKTYNPQEGIFSDVLDTSRAYDFVEFEIKPDSYISDGYLSQIEKINPGFVAAFKGRELQAPVGFTVKQNTEILLLPALKKSLDAIPAFAELQQEQVTLEHTYYDVTFKEKECQMQAKTIVTLSKSPLIYKLYGNLTDTADDNPNELMNLFIPRDQSVRLNPVEYTAYNKDSGTAKFGEVAPIIETEERWKVILPAGEYSLPFALFRDLVKAAPAAQISHQHNLDRGVIALDLEEQTLPLKLPKAEFDRMVNQNPKLQLAAVSSFTVERPFKQFTLPKALELKLPTTDMSAFRQANDGSIDENGQARLNVLSEHVYPYSGGGVSGPIWGTALLVIACMVVGLIIGVAAAVYLGEYARKGKFISYIRLSMMNLAGVPSIVFGIFGLGLFVSLAPKLTVTPSIDNKVRVAVLPAFSKPDVRTQERLNIKIIEKGSNLENVLRAAQQQGMERYYTGKTYLSFQGWGNSIIAGAFTLAMMVLPIIITSSEESLRAVPRGFREASLALGATKWQSIKTAVLPYATPGILTASVLSITRVAGETAPIMFTAAVAAKSDLPINGLQGSGFGKFLEFISQSVQAMPYHIYTISGRLPPSHHIKPMQYGSVLVFMIIVMIFAALSVWLRIRVRKKYKW